MEKNSPEISDAKAEPEYHDNVIQFPGVGTFMYNSIRLYNYESSLRNSGMSEEADIVAHCALLYEASLIDIDWDPATGEPILVAST